MKILFITATRLGDAVLTTGLLDYLVKTYPACAITVACGTLPQSIFEGFPNVEKIIPMVKKRRNGHWVDLWKQVIGTQWDIVVDLRNSAVSRLICAKKRYIYTKARGAVKDLHKVEQLGRAMGLDTPPSPHLYFTPAQMDFAMRLIEPDKGIVLGVGPASNWIAKTWPAENFITVLQWMISHDGPATGARVAVFAAPGEEAQARPVLESIPEVQRIDCIAKGNPGQVAAAISFCDFYIGNDSGLMHTAAAAGVPTLGLFGPTYPHIYGPWGDKTAYLTTLESTDELIGYKGFDPKKIDATLMTGLKPQDVISVIKEFEPFYDRLSLHLRPKNTAR